MSPSDKGSKMSSRSKASKAADVVRNLVARGVWRKVPGAALQAALGHQPVFLDYHVDPRPRWGYGLPAHPELKALIDGNRWKYLQVLSAFEPFAGKLSRISEMGVSNATEPYWQNQYMSGLSAVALYCFPAIRNPRCYMEVGSGSSTKFVRRSITDNQLSTRIVSIDPVPRAEIDTICDEVIRQPLESLDLSIFKQLTSGDIVVLDGSHRVFQNSDVTVFLLDVLPKLPAGVLLYIDDIYLPFDYPPKWRNRFYSEQYMLAALLLGDRMRRYEVVLPQVFIDSDDELFEASANLWAKIGRDARRLNVPGPYGRSGNGMWIEIRDEPK